MPLHRKLSLCAALLLVLGGTRELRAQEPAATSPTPPAPQATVQAAAPEPATASAETPSAAVTEQTPAPAAVPPETPLAAETTATETAPTANADADAEAEAEAARILASVGDESTGYNLDDGPTLDIYGFVDFRLLTMLRNDTEYVEALYGESATFAVGNVNLYAAGDLGSGWKSLLEVRFLYLPNGSLDSLSGTRQRTIALDYTDGSRPIRWSGIMIERAWLEYSAHSLLTIRGGQWLTPVGIWNVDHGTPTIIPIMRPYVIAEGLFPLRQTGIEVYGSQLFGETTLGYHLTVSNGRGSIDDYQELDGNKGIGGRAYVSFEPLGTLTLGISGYKGRSTSADVAVGLMGSAPVIEQKLLDQYDEVGYAADLLWLYEGLHVQGEMLAQEVAYTNTGRPAPDLPVPGGGLVPDHRRVGLYGLIGYRLPWLTIMPYVMIQYMDYGLDDITAPGSIGSGQVYIYAAGLNVRPTAPVALKVQLLRATIEDAAGLPETVLDELIFSAAWSF